MRRASILALVDAPLWPGSYMLRLLLSVVTLAAAMAGRFPGKSHTAHLPVRSNLTATVILWANVALLGFYLHRCTLNRC